MYFEGWNNLGHILLATVVVYALLVLALRITGKRTTSKMNSFDWIVTVALGSMGSTVILVDEVPLVEGIAGIIALIVVQYFVAWLSVHSSRAQKFIQASPTLLFYRGEFNDDAMRLERVTRDEVLAAIRTQGFARLENVLAVVLETNADLSIVPSDDPDEEQTLHNVKGWEPPES